MQVHFGTELLHPEWRRAVVCVGTFDGVHLGHQEVVTHAVELARSAELPPILVTFDRHPAAILAPGKCPKAISALSANLGEFARLGVSLTVVLPFNAWLSRMSAETFLREILVGSLRAERLVVGHDFAMGNGREGTTEWLADRIATTVIPPFEWEGHRVSSSEIRRRVAEGDVETAARLLGRPFVIPGVVVTGDRLGRELGYPTANIARSFDQVLPADGVYAGRMGDYRAAVSIGTRPSVDGVDRRIEAYLLDYPGDSLYGQSVELALLRRLRGQEKFDSLDALKAQMAKDVEAARLT